MSSFRKIIDEDLNSIAFENLPWERLAGKRVLVTGAGGFIGGYIVRALDSLYRLGRISQPVQITAMARDVTALKSQLSDLHETESIEFVQWDLSQLAIPAMTAPHYVIHAASQASPRYYGSDPVGTLLPNTVGTAALLSLWNKCDDPGGFMFVSSSEVYGQLPNGEMIDEMRYGLVDPTTVRACYAESKKMGETMCVAWGHQYKKPVFIVRPFHTYGPGLKRNDGRVFADFIFNAVDGKDIVMNSDGSARRAFCYISDLILGFFYVLFVGEAATAYNVANANADAQLSVLELANLVSNILPNQQLKVVRKEDVVGANYLKSKLDQLMPNTMKLQSLGWQAKIGPASGFLRTIQSYK